MKTARRHELQTNELSQQLDELWGFFSRYGRQLLAAVAVIGAIVMSGYWYVASQRAERDDAWANFYDVENIIGKSADEQMAHFRRVLERKSDPMLSSMAVLKIGEIALQEAAKPGVGDSAKVDWLKKADEAFNEVLRDHADQVISAGNARLALGMVAESRGEVAKARDIYQKIVDDSALKDLPIRGQAEYRLRHVDSWATPVAFASAPPPTTQPGGMSPMSITPTMQELPAPGSSITVPVQAAPATPPPAAPATTPPAAPATTQPK